jgi:hypothetical protein
MNLSLHALRFHVHAIPFVLEILLLIVDSRMISLLPRLSRPLFLRNIPPSLIPLVLLFLLVTLRLVVMLRLLAVRLFALLLLVHIANRKYIMNLRLLRRNIVFGVINPDTS